MIWSSIPNDERLRLWKKLRDELKGETLNEQLDRIAKFCSTIPFGSRSIDYYTPEDWPSPWEILYHDLFCTSSISVLIFYTFILVNEIDDIELYLVEDSEDIYLLPVVDNQYVLNYELGKVNTYSEIKDCIKIIKKFPKHRVKTIT